MNSAAMRVAEVSSGAIVENVQRVAALSGSQVIAVVKADGYGHGMQQVAAAALAGGAVALGVADLDEALQLRAQGFDRERARILCWLHGGAVDYRAALAANIELGLSHSEQLLRLAEAVAVARDKGVIGQRFCVSVQLKIDTGLSRNGAAGCDWQQLFELAAKLEKSGVLRVTGVFSHLANAGSEANYAQAEAFDRALEMAFAAGLSPEMQHLAASAAVLENDPRLRYNTVRVGLAVYGLSPFEGVTAAELGLRPALRLRAEIVGLRQVAAGVGVSYGFNYKTVEPTTLALVPIGYADGMPRALNNAGALVLVAGQARPIVGRIGMDQCVVDLGAHLANSVAVGDYVVLFGDPLRGEPAVEDWAACLDTINYEIIARLGARIKRVAVD